MAKRIHVVPDEAGHTAHIHQAPVNEARLSELFRQLANDSTTLIRQEVGLARSELRANMKTMGKHAALLAVGGSILMVGLLVLTAFLVALLGDALDNYWLAALIVGLAYAVIGGALLLKARNDLRHEGLKPDRTLETLREDKRWAQAELQQVRRGLST